MVEFNQFTYILCFFSSVLAVALHFVDYRWKRRSRFGGGGHNDHNAEFLSFQRRFFLGYLPCLFADSLQAPYLYFLYQSYGFLESQIVMLYVVGFLTSMTFSILGVYVMQRAERKMLCLIFVGLNSISCLLKFSNNYGVLMFSRIADGLAGSLLNAPFQEWYVDHHIGSFDFPTEWIPITFRKTAIIHAYLAIVAGFTAEFSESTFRITAFPFLLAIPILFVGGFFIHNTWGESRLELSSRPKLWPQFRRGLKVIGSNPAVFLLSAIQSLFESCIYMFAFLWTPLFLYLKPLISVRPSFGGIYSAFMASVLLGTVLQRILARKLSSVFILNIATALGFVSMALVVLLAYPNSSSAPSTAASGGGVAPISILRFEVILLVFGTFQTSCGLYFPSVQRLQKEILPREDRSAILGLFRVPLNLIAAVGLLTFHSHQGVDKQYGNWMILIICMILLGLAALASLLLQSMIRRANNNVLPVNRHLSSGATAGLLASMQAANGDDDIDDEI